MKKPTISDVAKKAGVSKTAVSFSINNRTSQLSRATREKIQRAIEELRYYPSPSARNLAKGNTSLIGVVAINLLADPFTEAIRGIEEQARTRGKALLIGIYRLLDRFNLAPWSLIKMDPFYSSIYIANLGSLGLNAPYHHLYEWGNTSIFLVIGKMFSKELWHGGTRVRQRYIELRVTIDERIADCIRSLGRCKCKAP